ncbi:MAG: redoxin domain-containing protein [Gemmataceae bacterium]|nr:redoxin domain-containing protein [Gemmataceae bacterium]
MNARRILILLSVAAILGIASCTRIPSSERSQESHRRIGDFVLRDMHGQTQSLQDFAQSKFLIVVFLGIECPLAKRCVPLFNDLPKSFASHVAVIGIDANAQDSPSRLQAFARETSAAFPILCDPDQVVADRFGAQRTPEAFVLDEMRRIRFQGRVGDGGDLREALGDLFAGRAVRNPAVPAVGCRIGRRPATAKPSDLAFGTHIRPILEARCGECHRPGEIAPFGLLEWKEVAAWSATIREVVEDGRMPPWHADAKAGHFRNDARLTSEEKARLMRWIDDGCPEGPPAIPSAPRFIDGWRIPSPSLILAMSEKPFPVPATGALDYQCFVVDPGFREDKFVQSAEVRPGNRAVVHHALISLIAPGADEKSPNNLGAMLNYAPGMQATQLPPGWAIRIPAGSKFLFQMHYTPNGKAHVDRTSLGLVWVDAKSVKHEVRGGAIANPSIAIPAFAADHTETAEQVFREDIRLLSVSPHMHLRGKAFRIEAAMPDGERKILLQVPRYDFHWQLRYEFADPIRLPAGSRLICVATYDNSAGNRNNPNPSQRVTWGDQTSDEMLIGFFSYVEDQKERTHTMMP